MNHSASQPNLSATAEALVARQPIFDSELHILAHELLYRASAGDNVAVLNDARAATLNVIMNACLEIGLDHLVGSKPAYINFPKELLVGDAPLPLPLPPERIVIEVLEDVSADPEVMNSVAALRRHGHMVALDDFSFEHSDAALLDLADVVKVDIMNLDTVQLERTCKALHSRNLLLIAEKIETLEQFEHCRRLGFRGFQGFFLHRPETFSGRRMPTNRLAILRIMAELQDPQVSISDLERLVGRDTATSYRMLRCINSSYYNLPRPISTLREAIVIMGLDQLRRLCALVMLAGFDDRPGQLLIDAMTRARMCELLAHRAGVSDGGPYFVTGLFSVLDALVAQPLAEALSELPLAAPITLALLQGEGDLGAALACVRHYEIGDWSKVQYGGLDSQQIRAAYVQALRWAEESRALMNAQAN